MINVAINGFGRVGRAAYRAACESGLGLELVAVNDIADRETLTHLLAHDTVYGAFPAEALGGVSFFSETDPARLPWRDLDVDVVLECTGKLKKRVDAAKHLEAGARKVIVSAPAPDADATIVVGVNDETYDPERHHVVSNASCTTNCLAPVAKLLHDTVGIRHGLMTTIHAYTGDQRLVDGPHKDLRRARAAAWNLVPTTTGAAKAIGLVIPELAGKLHGYAVRVPIPTGSIVDLTVETERATTAHEVNELFRAADGDIIHYSEEPLVSSDIVKAPYSAIVDAPLTTVVNGTQLKVVAWYDNEWGYATRLVELATRMLVPAYA